MKKFSGFPDGKVAVTPLPNLFFSELLPSMDDLAELKVTLHIFWLMAEPNRRAKPVTASELRGDRTLMQSLAAIGDAQDALTRGLDAAVERGTLLCGDVDDPVYFANTQAGRRAYEKFESQVETIRAEPAPIQERPNIFSLYEQNVGLLTPIIADELKDAEKQYSAEWIADAIKIAVEHNKRNWRYIAKILARWHAEGRAGESKKRKRWYGDEYGKYINR
ncbi:MAG: DnaD domain protein [Chloroflexi bacterium]|nr:DnaD domain protein [Chloroflexota bacterium]